MRFATAACHPKCQNARFATAACAKMYEMSAWRRQSPAAYKNHRFTTVSNARPARSDERVSPSSPKIRISPRARKDERVARAHREFAFHHSFGRPTITFCVKGCFVNVKNLHFTTVLGVRRARNDEKRRIFKEEQHFKRSSIFEEQPSKSSFFEQPFSAAFLSSLFPAAFLSCLSQQPFLAAFLSSPSQQPFSAALLSSLFQQPFSAAFLSSLSQQPFLAAFLSCHPQPSSCCRHALVVSYCHHLAVVRGWWSASNIILLWSGVGGQLVTSSCCRQGLVVKYATVL